MTEKKGAIRACCKNPDNLYVSVGRDEQRSDLTIRRCRICDRRHFEAIVDPGKLGMHGARM